MREALERAKAALANGSTWQQRADAWKVVEAALAVEEEPASSLSPSGVGGSMASAPSVWEAWANESAELYARVEKAHCLCGRDGTVDKCPLHGEMSNRNDYTIGYADALDNCAIELMAKTVPRPGEAVATTESTPHESTEKRGEEPAIAASALRAALEKLYYTVNGVGFGHDVKAQKQRLAAALKEAGTVLAGEHEYPANEPQARIDELKDTVIALCDPEFTVEQRKAYISGRMAQLRALLSASAAPPVEQYHCTFCDRNHAEKYCPERCTPAAPRDPQGTALADEILLRIAKRYESCSVNIYPDMPCLTPVEAVLRCAQEEGFVLRSNVPAAPAEPAPATGTRKRWSAGFHFASNAASVLW